MTLLDLLSAFKKKWYLLVIFPLIFGLVTACYCWGVMKNVYSTSATLYVLNKNASSNKSDTTNNTPSSGDLSLSSTLAKDISSLASTDRVKAAVAKSLGMNSLAGYSTSVSNDSSSNSSTSSRIIKLSVTGKDPAGVAKVANQMATEIGNVAIEVLDVSSVSVIDQARMPTAPIGPNRTMYTLYAIGIGLLVAMAVIVLIEALSRSVKSPEEAEELFGVPILGRIPYVKMK